MTSKDTNGHFLLPTWFLASILTAALSAVSVIAAGGIVLYGTVTSNTAKLDSLVPRVERIEDAIVKRP